MKEGSHNNTHNFTRTFSFVNSRSKFPLLEIEKFDEMIMANCNYNTPIALKEVFLS